LTAVPKEVNGFYLLDYLLIINGQYRRFENAATVLKYVPDFDEDMIKKLLLTT